MRRNILLIAGLVAVAFLLPPPAAWAKSKLQSKKDYAAKKYGKNSKKYKSYVKKYEKSYASYAAKKMKKYQSYYEKKYGKGSYLAKKALQSKKAYYQKKYGVAVQNPLGAPTSADYKKYQSQKVQAQLEKAVKSIQKKYGKGSYKAKQEAEKKKKYYEKKYGVTLKNPIGAPTKADLQKETQKWQDQLAKDQAYYEKKYGKASSKAEKKVQQKLKYYEKQYGVDLENPVTKEKAALAKKKKEEEAKKKKQEELAKQKQKLTEKYNDKLDDLAKELLDEGMSSSEVAKKVAETKDYYEDKYGLSLDMPDIQSVQGQTDVTVQTKEDTTWKESYIKDSIRRLGGIITDQRPVSTFIGDDYTIRAGFKRGVSIFDRKLLFKPPVGFPERKRPKKLAVVTKEVVQ